MNDAQDSDIYKSYFPHNEMGFVIMHFYISSMLFHNLARIKEKLPTRLLRFYTRALDMQTITLCVCACVSVCSGGGRIVGGGRGGGGVEKTENFNSQGGGWLLNFFFYFLL